MICENLKELKKSSEIWLWQRVLENGDEVFDGPRFDAKTISFSDTAERNVKLARAPTTTTTITVRSLKRKEVRFEIVGEGKNLALGVLSSFAGAKFIRKL